MDIFTGNKAATRQTESYYGSAVLVAEDIGKKSNRTAEYNMIYNTLYPRINGIPCVCIYFFFSSHLFERPIRLCSRRIGTYLQRVFHSKLYGVPIYVFENKIRTRSILV